MRPGRRAPTIVADRRWPEILVGAAVLAVGVGFLGYALTTGGRGMGLSMVAPAGLALTARFDRIDGLGDGAAVRIAGVRVGSVTATRIDPASFEAEVSLRLDSVLRLPIDTSAEVASEGLLGGKYVALVPGGSDRLLAEGGRITETQGSVSLEQLLGRFIFSVTQMNAARGTDAPAPVAE
jgi:phospholipid/cholesterol/gamma-HCH transport system substrate-binding protein